jgi:class 3 adenylate cyclase/Tfp pilus assembly protein PilF
MRSISLFIVLTLCFISISFFTCIAQQNLDSLYSVWQDKTQPDSNRTNAYKDYIWHAYLFSNPDTAYLLALNLLSFGETQSYKKAEALAYSLMGVSSHLKSNYPKAIKFYQSSLKISKEIGDRKGEANSLINIGMIYRAEGDNPKALEFYQLGLKISEEIGDKSESANAISNIGVIYRKQGDYPKALDYLQRSLSIAEEIGDRNGSAKAIMSIGNIYNSLEEYAKALEYYQRSLELYEEIGDKNGSASSIGNIGYIYAEQKQYPEALKYFQQSLKFFEEIGDKKGSAIAINSIGLIYQKQGNYIKALEYCNESLLMTKEIGALEREKEACECLYETYKSMGNGNEALVYLEKMHVIGDSLKAEETNKQLQQMEFAKVFLQDSIAKADEARLLEEAHQKEVRQKNKTRNIFGGIGFFALLIAGGFFWSWRYVQKSKAVLQVEKDRSENLLLNILPADIAAELKEKGRADARDFDKVSILFTDFKGFTEQSAKLSAADLVNEINVCFEAFDIIMEKYDIEKIKTIGDAYMAAGGLPIPNNDSVKNTVVAALEIQEFIQKRKNQNDITGKPAFEMRVGIHTGPVVAGIVGIKKFQYDIWGDTVNTASRMESSGEVGKVNISAATYELVKNDFNFEFRGDIDAKGKGKMGMYFVSMKNDIKIE